MKSTELNERNRYWFWADHKWGCSQPVTVLFSLLPIPLDWFGATPEKVILKNEMC